MNKRNLQLGAAVAAAALLVAVLVAFLVGPGAPLERQVARTYNTNVYREQGGNKLVVASTGEIEVQSGGILDIQSGATTGWDAAMDFDSTLNVDGAVTFTGVFYPSFTNETITDGELITPTYTTYALDSASAVTLTLQATGTEGQPLILIGDDNFTITVADTNIRTSDGAAVTIGQWDVVLWVYQDNEWLLIAKSANS